MLQYPHMILDTSVATLKGVGNVLEKNLARLRIETLRNLLFHFPFRYEDFSEVKSIAKVAEGETATVRGKIELIANKRSPRKRTVITEALIADDTDRMRIVWFGQPFITKALSIGDDVYFSGSVSSDMFGVQMISPTYEKVKKRTTHTARIVPMYPLTRGITQKQLRYLVSQIIHYAKTLEEWLPEDVLGIVDLVPYGDAIRGIHFPEDNIDLAAAKKRLAFDELFLLQIRGRIMRDALARGRAPKLLFKEKEIKAFVDTLPFALTKTQKIAAWEIFQDMEKIEPMNRLLEGDVGSGKTVVAAMAIKNAAANKQQSVFMAPTEILAAQHVDSLKTLFSKDVPIAFLTRTQCVLSTEAQKNKTKTSWKQYVLKRIASGDVPIVVGTHALLSEGVSFHALGLVIVDEQHRFGVAQRKTIREKSGDALCPHFLSMSATPIPRSFALTLYGDLDLSMITEMPAGRKPIQTRVVEPQNREKAYGFIRDQIKKGRQVFVICPLIDDGASSEKKSVLSEYKKFSEMVFPELRVGYLHGKLPARGGSALGKKPSKDAVMTAFKGGKIDILVSTSVVEVGVDVPNASVMVIEGADRFGLAQLHQFRGRVGRSDHQSYCFLFTENTSQKVADRLAFFEAHTDGFRVAEYDLQQRGPGEVYGTAQSGVVLFRFATMKDRELVKQARTIARTIDTGAYPALKKHVEAWERRVHLE